MASSTGDAARARRRQWHARTGAVVPRPPGQPAPTDPAALSFLTLTSRPTVGTEFKSIDGGKTAVYMLRWVNTRGEKGPWSEICSATVAA